MGALTGLLPYRYSDGQGSRHRQRKRLDKVPTFWKGDLALVSANTAVVASDFRWVEFEKRVILALAEL